MRICCMIASLRLGGAERQLTGLALMLHAQGHEVEVLTYREGSFYARMLEDSGIKLTQLHGKGGSLKIVREVSSHLRANGCEVLISFLRGANIKACLIKRRCPGLKTVVSERNCDIVLLPHTAFRFFMYRNADAVVCNSYAQEAFVRKHARHLAGRLTAIPNFVDSDYFTPPAQQRTDDGMIRLVTTARLNDRKNPVGLIMAFAEAACDNLRLDWYGSDGQDACYRKCMRLICRLGLQDRVHIHPASQDVKGVYAESDVFCLPSFYEGTPNAMAEAMACGLPAICSDVSDNSRYVIPGKTGLLFDPSKRESIASALKVLSSTSRAELRSWGENGRLRVVELLSMDDFIDRYSSLLGSFPG